MTKTWTDQEILSAVREGRINEVTQGLLSFGFYLIKRYRHDRKYDTAVSEMQWQLLMGLRELETLTPNESVLGYLTCRIKNGVKRAVAQDKTIGVSSTTTAKGAKFKIMRLEITEIDLKSQSRSKLSIETEEALGRLDTNSKLELIELLDTLKLDERDLEILKLKVAGYSAASIANTLGVTAQAIHLRVSKICKKIGNGKWKN